MKKDKKLIPYGRQFIDRSDKLNLFKILSKEKITSGNEVLKFENKIKKFFKVKYSLSCNSGTSAIFLAFK